MNYAAETGGGGSAFPFIILIGFAIVVYFLMIRPQQKRRREVENMQSSMGVGDEIVTVGGLYGIVVEIDTEEGTVLLETSPGVTAKYARAAIGKVNQKAAADEDAAEEEEESAGAADAD